MLLSMSFAYSRPISLRIFKSLCQITQTLSKISLTKVRPVLIYYGSGRFIFADGLVSSS